MTFIGIFSLFLAALSLNPTLVGAPVAVPSTARASGVRRTLVNAAAQAAPVHNTRAHAASQRLPTVEGEWKLRRVNVLLRHGKRAPIEGVSLAEFPMGAGNLIKPGVSGSRDTGRFIKKLYVDDEFLSVSTLAKDLYITATDVKRAQDSAKAAVQGMSGAEGENLDDIDSYTSPVPIDAQLYPVHGLYSGPLMKPTDFRCPRFNELAQTAIIGYANWLNKNYMDLINMAEKQMHKKFTVHEFRQLEGFFHKHVAGVKVDDWMLQEIPKYKKSFAEMMYELCFYYQIAVAKGEAGQLRAGRLLYDWMQPVRELLNVRAAIMQRKKPVEIAKLQPKYKMVMYGCHSETQIGLMGAMGIKEAMLYPTSGAILMEIWENKSSHDYKVRMRQYGKENDEEKILPLPLPFYNNETECPLEAFYNKLKDHAIADMNELQTRCTYRAGKPVPESAAMLPDVFQRNFQLNLSPISKAISNAIAKAKGTGDTEAGPPKVGPSGNSVGAN